MKMISIGISQQQSMHPRITSAQVEINNILVKRPVFVQELHQALKGEGMFDQGLILVT